MTYSPLRYPGGKNKLAPFIAKICVDNKITEHCVEPYSGGASVALFLLMEGLVKKITINDKDRSIFAFWHSVLYQSEELCDMIIKTPITMNEWEKQKKIQKEKQKVSLLELGFSTFFLNRTNRSGIINAGVIGGRQQEGKYKMNCRFNKDRLIERINIIAEKKDVISLFNKDAVSLIDEIILQGKNNGILLYLDPPYYEKGDSLYMNYYKKIDHQEVSEIIKQLQNISWIVSYDNAQIIKDLYSDCLKMEYTLMHTAAISKESKELLFFSSNICFDKNRSPLEYALKKNKNQVEFVYKTK